MYQDFIEKVISLVTQYDEQLSELGIKCKVSKKYFETNTPEVSSNHKNILNIIYLHLANKRENKKFKNQRNRYHCIVLTFSPINNNSKNKEYKEYSFLLNKIERIEKGFKPREKNYKEEKSLKRIEKLILSVVKKAQRKTPNQICTTTWFDILRYVFSIKYDYKKNIAGRDKNFWDILFAIPLLLLFISGLVLMYLHLFEI